MARSTRPNTRTTGTLLIVALLGGTRPSSPVDVPGGGGTRSDCYAGFEVGRGTFVRLGLRPPGARLLERYGVQVPGKPSGRPERVGTEAGQCRQRSRLRLDRNVPQLRVHRRLGAEAVPHAM